MECPSDLVNWFCFLLVPIEISYLSFRIPDIFWMSPMDLYILIVHLKYFKTSFLWGICCFFPSNISGSKGGHPFFFGSPGIDVEGLQEQLAKFQPGNLKKKKHFPSMGGIMMVDRSSEMMRYAGHFCLTSFSKMNSSLEC